jgi:hypothetical protein
VRAATIAANARVVECEEALSGAEAERDAARAASDAAAQQLLDVERRLREADATLAARDAKAVTLLSQIDRLGKPRAAARLLAPLVC